MHRNYNKMHSLLVVLLCISLTAALPAQNNVTAGMLTIAIANGTISGLHLGNYNQDVFLGVPFAQPPTGELRFRNPQSINTTFRDTIVATDYAPLCVGYGVCCHFLLFVLSLQATKYRLGR